MWKLINIKQEHREHFLFVGEECVVGRKDAALLITNDPSVSRKHAALYVRFPEENISCPSKKPSLFMRDEGSKYGTFKNGVKVTSEQCVEDGDIVKFGQFESEFKVEYVPLVVTTSCLDVGSKIRLRKIIHKLGGHLVSEWQSTCTHLVMSQVKITIKAVCCLVSLKSIVLPEYFEELERHLKNTGSTLSPSEFIPPIGESLIDKEKASFDVNSMRKDIFKAKTFYFMDEKQFKKLHLGISIGGGSASILSEDKTNINVLLQPGSCFIEPMKDQAISEKSKLFLKNILSSLQNNNLRVIPESDIGLAVAYASTEQFCNPSFNIGSVVLGSQKIPSQTYSEREVYVPDTEEQSKSKPISLDSALLLRSKKQTCVAPDSLNLTSFTKPNISLQSGSQSTSKNQCETHGSLNFTSFKEDVEEVQDSIPLSAVVKKELDNIFDMEEDDAGDNFKDQETFPPTLPVQPPTVSNEQQKRNTAETIPTKNSPKKLKVEDDVLNFEYLHMNGNDEADLPRNLAKIEYAVLVCRRPVTSGSQRYENSNVKNFKKFKKVLPKKTQVLPKIIGGNDLIPYDRDASKLADDIWNDEAEVANNQPVKGAFDWETPNF